MVGILLYRKHVVTKQPYINQLIRYFEAAGLKQLASYLQAYFGEELSEDVVGAIASEKNPPSPPVPGGAKETYSHYPSTLTGKGGSEFPQRLEEARQIRDLLMQAGDELGNTWRDRNVFSYGRRDKGQSRPEILTQLLQTTSRIVQEIDSVEYGLTDIQEYYANTGGLKKAAEQQRDEKVARSEP